MTGKYTTLKLEQIIIPHDVMVRYSQKRIDRISNAFGTENELLFFVIVVGKGDTYHLVDRYDVYVAAKTTRQKTIRCLVIPEYDDLTSSVVLSMKSLPNPATVIRLLKPFVKQYGISKTLEMFYLDPVFDDIYKYDLEDAVILELENLVNTVGSSGVSITPSSNLFSFLSKLKDVDDKILLLKRLSAMAKALGSKFVYPTNTFLNHLLEGETSQKKSPDKAFKQSAREFCCNKCNEEYVVTDDYIGPKVIKDDVIVISKDQDQSHPVYTIPEKYQTFLGINNGVKPVIFSSKDYDATSMVSKLKGKKFIIIVGSNVA